LRIDKHLEQLLAAFGMVGQRPVPERESRLVATVVDVDHSSTIQGPKPEMANQDCYDRPDLDRSVARKRVDPSDMELLPRRQRRARSIEIRRAVANRDELFVEAIVARPFSDESNWPVGQWQLA